MAVALAYQGSFGFALQTSKGGFAAPDNWLPLIELPGQGPADTVALRKNFVALDLADQRAFQTNYFSAGEWVEGELRFPLVPGALTDLLGWIQDRDGTQQGRWASAVIDCVHEVKQITDLKVRRATLDLVGGEPVTCTLQVVGLGMQRGTAGAATMPTAAPYLFREAAVTLGCGGVAASEGNLERLRIVIDTGLQAPAEGMRLAPSVAPAQLYNLSGVRASGSFSRDFVDSGVYADFVGGTEASLAVSLVRGGAEAEVVLPRIVHLADHLGLPGSHEQRLVERVEFMALGSADGTEAPVRLG
jgi:hypothetical protein